MLCLWK